MRAVVGLFPANAVGDDIEVYADESRSCVLTTLNHLRQQKGKPAGQPHECLADYVAPKEAGAADWIGAFAVTAGIGIDEHVKRFEAAHDDYSAILLKALADRLAEAFAEKLHEVVRQELWGYETVRLSNEQLIKEEYQGIRPAPGYPACPDHTEKPELFRLLDATKHTGITLTESLAMSPAAAVSGWYFAHPQAKYFGVGRVAKDQITDLARRKVRVVERQADAGSQQLLAHLLAEARVTRGQLQVTPRPAHAETDLAAAIHEGKADAGVGIEAAARAHGLAFIPLATERLDLLLRRRDYFESNVQALLAFARTADLREQAAALGGYDVSHTGRVVFNG